MHRKPYAFAATNLEMSNLEDLQTHYVFKHSVLSNMICCLSFRVPPGRGAAGAESVCFEIARFVFLICECRAKDEMHLSETLVVLIASLRMCRFALKFRWVTAHQARRSFADQVAGGRVGCLLEQGSMLAMRWG